MQKNSSTIIFSSHTNEFTRECHLDNAETKVTSKLNDREKKQAALPIAVFGMEMVMKSLKRRIHTRITTIKSIKYFIMVLWGREGDYDWV